MKKKEKYPNLINNREVFISVEINCKLNIDSFQIFPKNNTFIFY